MRQNSGFWNYTEPITFEVVEVSIGPVEKPVTHWQNCYVGTIRQALRITARNGSETFVIDNEDGMGIAKIAHGGGPDSPHRSIENYHVLGEVDPRNYRAYDAEKARKTDEVTDKWMEKNHPEAWARIKSLKATVKHFSAPNFPPGGVLPEKAGKSPEFGQPILTRKQIKKLAQKERRK